MPKKASRSSKRTTQRRTTPTGGRRFFFKLELLGKRRTNRPFDYDNLDPIVDTPPDKAPVRSLFQSPHTSGKENNNLSLAPSALAPTLPIHNIPWPERVALISEDHTEDAVVITTLDTVPFCCHEDLITMSRKQLIGVALALNARLPAVLAIDTDEALATSWIRASIERVVGIRADVPQAPKVVRVLKDSNGPLERKGTGPGSSGKIDRTPPTSPLASRSQQFGSMVSPGLDRLVEEDEEDDDDEEADRLSKRRKLVFADTGGESDSDVVMASDAEQTPTPHPQRSRSCFLKAKPSPSPAPTRVLRSRSQTAGIMAAVDTSFMYEGRPQARYQRKPNKDKVQAKTEEALLPIGASRLSGRLRPISRPRALLPAEQSTLPRLESATGAKRKRNVDLSGGEAAQHVTSGINRMTMRSGNELDSDSMDIRA